MKIQYLVFVNQDNPADGLQSITQKEFDQILFCNRNLSGECRRFFIQDDICDCGEIDRIYIETTKEDYKRWHAEHEQAKYNRKKAADFLILSGDAMVGPNESLFDTLPDPTDLEEMVLDSIQIQKLKDALNAWKSWGVEMLSFYLSENKNEMIKALSEKYHVSERSIRKWKKCFESFVFEFMSHRQ